LDCELRGGFPLVFDAVQSILNNITKYAETAANNAVSTNSINANTPTVQLPVKVDIVEEKKQNVVYIYSRVHVRITCKSFFLPYFMSFSLNILGGYGA
jgi:hypothetical protein